MKLFILVKNSKTFAVYNKFEIALLKRGNEDLGVHVTEIGCPSTPFKNGIITYHDRANLHVTNYENLTFSHHQIEPFKLRLTAEGGDGCDKVYTWLVKLGITSEFSGIDPVIERARGQIFTYTFKPGDNYLELVESSPDLHSSPELFKKFYVLSFDLSGNLLSIR